MRSSKSTKQLPSNRQRRFVAGIDNARELTSQRLAKQPFIVSLPVRESSHLRNVLRLNSGDSIEIVDRATGAAFRGVVEPGEGYVATIRLIEAAEADALPGPPICAIIGLPKASTADYDVEKLTELGIEEICFFTAQRTQGRDSAEKRNERVARWQRIADAAIKQSGQRAAPLISLESNLGAVMDRFGSGGSWKEAAAVLKLYCAAPLQPAPFPAGRNSERPDCPAQLIEKTDILSILALLGQNGPLCLQKSHDIDEIYVLVGPEGGLSREEIELLNAEGFQAVSLGRRTLRSETALTVVFGILTAWRAEQLPSTG